MVHNDLNYPGKWFKPSEMHVSTLENTKTPKKTFLKNLGRFLRSGGSTNPGDDCRTSPPRPGGTCWWPIAFQLKSKRIMKSNLRKPQKFCLWTDFHHFLQRVSFLCKEPLVNGGAHECVIYHAFRYITHVGLHLKFVHYFRMSACSPWYHHFENFTFWVY